MHDVDNMKQFQLGDIFMIYSVADQERKIDFGNYCTCFIDLLGQKNALKGEGLLPSGNTEEEQSNALKNFQKSIRPIIVLHRAEKNILEGIISQNQNSPLRASLSTEQQQQWDDMLRNSLKKQRWSDGIVYFICLGDARIKCPINDIYSMFCLAGALCIILLASKIPIRGAMDVAWGAELYPGELYGAAVARAYELESEVAQYPRIVVGYETVRYIEVLRKNNDNILYENFSRDLAETCNNMLTQDIDGNWIVHYLGDEFREAIGRARHSEFYRDAKTFVMEQIEEHKRNKNTKLDLRYHRLLSYFDAYPPTEL